MGEQLIDLKLTIEEVNVVLLILSERPYKEVADIISKIREQGNSQISK